VGVSGGFRVFAGVMLGYLRPEFSKSAVFSRDKERFSLWREKAF